MANGIKLPTCLCRFYFLGDDDLLEILGQAANPAIIQQHLKKLFAGIHSVALTESAQTDGPATETGPGPQAVSHMRSVHGEAVELPCGGVAVTEVIEKWLRDLTGAMRAALKGELRAALQGTANNAGAQAWARQPSQVIGLSQEVDFTTVRSLRTWAHMVLLNQHSSRMQLHLASRALAMRQARQSIARLSTMLLLCLLGADLEIQTVHHRLRRLAGCGGGHR